MSPNLKKRKKNRKSEVASAILAGPSTELGAIDSRAAHVSFAVPLEESDTTRLAEASQKKKKKRSSEQPTEELSNGGPSALPTNGAESEASAKKKKKKLKDVANSANDSHVYSQNDVLSARTQLSDGEEPAASKKSKKKRRREEDNADANQQTHSVEPPIGNGVVGSLAIDEESPLHPAKKTKTKHTHSLDEPSTKKKTSEAKSVSLDKDSSSATPVRAADRAETTSAKEKKSHKHNGQAISEHSGKTPQEPNDSSSQRDAGEDRTSLLKLKKAKKRSKSNGPTTTASKESSSRDANKKEPNGHGVQPKCVFPFLRSSFG